MYPRFPFNFMVMSIGVTLILSACASTAPSVSLASLRIDPQATVDPAYAAKCPEPFLALTSSDYEVYLTDADSYSFDQHSVIKYNYGSRFDNAGWRYSPTIIAFLGLTSLNAWCQNHDPVGFQLAKYQAQYFINQVIYKDGFVTWSYDFPISMFEIPANFTSGFANAYILVFFTQLFAITGDERYLNLAQQTARSFNADVAEGGLRSIRDDGTYFFEEYAYPDAPTAHILNGHMVAVAALAYYGLGASDTLALKLADRGIAAVRSHLEDYDVNVYSLYDVGKGLYIGYSQSLHIQFLFWMYRYTNDPFFLEYALRWQNYARRDKYPLDIYGSSLAQGNDLLTKIILATTDLDEQLPGQAVSFALQDSAYFDLGQVRPMGAFRYFAEKSPTPENYTISISSDAYNWQDIVTVKDYRQRSASYCFDQVNARYIRLAITKLTTEGAAFDGIIRVDPPSFCKEAIVLVTQNDWADTSSTALNDANTTTFMPVPTDAIIYGDLRQPQQPTALVLAGNTSSIQLRAWLEISSDLQYWTPLIPENRASDITLPGTVLLPQPENAWQYFRLYLIDPSPQARQISIHTLSLSY
jgi:hypothetical protein